jgi:hypothetical protein
MSTRAALAAAFLVACGHSAPDAPDGGTAPDDAAPSDSDASDAGDAGSDSGVPDTTPPMLVSQSPQTGMQTWLHEPVRLVFDEAIAPASLPDLEVTATLAGSPIGAKLSVEGGKAIAITLDASARGIGQLAIHVAGPVADLAGNKLALDTSITLAVPAWHWLPIDRGAAQESPAVVASDKGAVYAAWSVGAAGSRRVVASIQDAGAWTSLGGMLGNGDTSSVAITLVGSDPVVAWIENGQARASRWDGTWHDLPSPGAGSYVALSGAYVAVFGTSATVGKLVNDAWQPLPSVAVAAPYASAPALAADGDKLAIGWIDSGRNLRVFRYMMTWMPIAPLSLGASPAPDHMSVAVRGPTVAVAWDQFQGSYGVLAASTAGTSWTRLGHTLDVDAASDAMAPAIAIDNAGAPVVAWTEELDGKQRGIVARWASSKWNILGGATFLVGDTARPDRAMLALHAAQTPIIGYAAGGGIAVQRFNGPKTPDFGIATRKSIAGCAISAANPPALLSQTGCFTIPTPGKPVPHQGLVPYDIVVKLWSDGAEKRRFIGLPDGGTMTLSSTGAWAAPNGTIITKEFDIETTVGDPSTRRAIETRFLVKDAQLGWQGFSYMWRANGADADLLNDGEYSYDWPTSQGNHHHVYPSRSQCLSCHEWSYGPLLGLRPPQLTRWVDYNGVIADQVATLAHLNVGPGTTATPFISPHDPSETSEHRMRGYMAANCAHCHNPQHVSIKDLRYTTPLSQTRLCEVIVPGSPSQSIVYQKVSNRPGMPPLGTAATDPLAVATLADWISGMTSCP